ncbi:MAG: RNA polymerase sigma factor [Planctomycetaceae bacterium]
MTRPFPEAIAPCSELAPDGLSDSERGLLQACSGGNREAQRQLYEQHCDAIHRLMYRLVGPSHADDLTQQVFLNVFQKLDKFQGRSSFATWLYRVASNEALQFLRRSRRDRRQPMLREPSDERPNGIDELEQHDLLESILSRLEPDLRAIFLLRESEGLSYYEIALVLDIAEGTVASRLSRARQSLRELIGNVS